MAFYELAELRLVDTKPSDLEAIQKYLNDPDRRGSLCAIWRSVVGGSGSIFILRQFESRPDLAHERELARRSSEPFGCGANLKDIDTTSYVPFARFDGGKLGEMGAFTQLTTYTLVPNGLPAIERLLNATAVRKDGDSRIILAMYAMDGRPRVVEIRAMASADEHYRSSVESQSPWPPGDAGAWMLEPTASQLLCDAR